jgi:cytochrome c551/c552
MKIAFFILVIVLFWACHLGKPANPNSPAGNALVNQGGHDDDSSATGRQLIAGNDCNSCHSINTQGANAGPSFVSIARRYPNSVGNAQNLAQSITKGSIGAWSTVHAMPAHTNVRIADAVKMAEYILSLKELTPQDTLHTAK